MHAERRENRAGRASARDERWRPSRRLVIELDGGVHREQRERDLVRDRSLASTYGVRVLRIDAELVERNVPAALAIVRAAL